MCDQVEGARSGFHAQQVDDDGHAQKCLKVFLLLLISKLLLWLLFAFDIAHSSPPMDQLAKKSAAMPLTICFVSQCKSEPVVCTETQGHGQSLSSSSVYLFFGSARRFLFCAA